MQLPEFLLARYAEVEQRERAEYQGDRTHYGSCFIVEREYGECDCTASVDLLADCEAKRRIVELAARLAEWDEMGSSAREDGEALLRLLALPYAAHPDHDRTWRP